VTNLITPRALFSPIGAYSCKAALYFLRVDRKPIPETYSFEIFQDGLRPPLGFISTGSRCTRKPYLRTKHEVGRM